MGRVPGRRLISPPPTTGASAGVAANAARLMEPSRDAATMLREQVDGAELGGAAEAAEPAITAAGDSLLDPALRDALVRVLDRRLVILALAVLLNADEDLPELARELNLALENGLLRVAMKVSVADGKTAPAALEALRSAGCTVSAEEPSRGLVVAEVPPSALPALARAKGILRVEPLVAGKAAAE